MPESQAHSDVADIVRRFLELRKAGERPSIDEAMETVATSGSSVDLRQAAVTALSRRTLTDSTDMGLGAPADVELDGYDLIDEIGRGGMGVVYEAYQRSTGRRVACKFMLESAVRTDAARRRFEREVELVARLQHPTIVSVLDSGVHDGRYFYIMEFIDGRPLDEVHPAGEWSIDGALTAVEKIARAVDYAHQRGVLHRDLKPSNILVDQRGEPHLLDFGLAKAIDPVSMEGRGSTISQPGQLIGTIGYMSPEQARGDIDAVSIRSDVFSLGALAYEIVTGQLPCPIDGPIVKVLRDIATRSPARPSSHRAMHEDVEAILMKSLEKHPSARYTTAGDMADDIRRYLDDELVLAIPPNFWRSTRRRLRQHRTLISISAAAMLVLVTVSGLYLNGLRNENRALQTAASTRQTLNSFYSMIDVNAGARATQHLTDLFDRVRQEVEQIDLPEEQASERLRLGDTLIKFGQYDAAAVQFNAALDIRRGLHGSDHPAVAEAMHQLARARFFQRDLEQAKDLYQLALNIRLRHFGRGDALVAQTLDHLAATHARLGEPEVAERMYQRAMDIRLTVFGEESLEVGMTRNNLGKLFIDRQQFEQAEPLFRSALLILQKLDEGSRMPLFEARTHHNIGECLLGLRRLDDARASLTNALDMKEILTGPDSRTVGKTLRVLAEVEYRAGRTEVARGHCVRAIDVLTPDDGEPASPDLIASQELLELLTGP